MDIACTSSAAPRGRRRILAVSALATAVLLSGCGGDDGGGGGGGDSRDGGEQPAASSLPAGFKAVTTRDLTVGAPSAWTVSGNANAPDTVLEVRPPGSDVNRAQLLAGSKRGYGDSIESATRLFVGDVNVRRPGSRKTSEQPVQVSGADAARRVEFTVPAGGRLASARIVAVLALRKTTLVTATVGTAQSDRTTDADAILRTLVSR